MREYVVRECLRDACREFPIPAYATCGAPWNPSVFVDFALVLFELRKAVSRVCCQSATQTGGGLSAYFFVIRHRHQCFKSCWKVDV